MQKSFNPNPRCQSLNLLKQEQKYWAVNDKMKLADTTGEEGPIDPFKTCYVPKKSKFLISEKVNIVNHWRNSNCIGDPEFKKGWRADDKWSQREGALRCQGKDRPYRTFEKIINHAKARDEDDAIRKERME